MSVSFGSNLTDPDFVQRVFDYQQAKRLNLLIDQLLWSFDLSSPDHFHIFQPHLRQMIMETRNHIHDLAHPSSSL